MPLRLPSINFFRLSRKRGDNAQHCVELVDLNQADVDYRFQYEHSVWEESPAPPPNTLCAGSSVVVLQHHPSNHFGLDLGFGGNFERDWRRRFGSSNSSASSLTVVHHTPFVSTPDATADSTAETSAASAASNATSSSTLTSPNPPSHLAATIRGRFKSAFRSNDNTTSNQPSTAHSSRLKTSRAHATHDSTAALHATSDKSAAIASNARHRSRTPPMSNPAHPPLRWRCCRCGRTNGNAQSNARAYDPIASRNRSTVAYPSKTPATKTATAIEDGTWTCLCGHSFEPCLLLARLRRLRRVQRKGGDVGVAFGRG